MSALQDILNRTFSCAIVGRATTMKIAIMITEKEKYNAPQFYFSPR